MKVLPAVSPESKEARWAESKGWGPQEGSGAESKGWGAPERQCEAENKGWGPQEGSRAENKGWGETQEGSGGLRSCWSKCNWGRGQEVAVKEEVGGEFTTLQR